APRTYAPQLEEFRLPTYPVSGIRGNVVLLRREKEGEKGKDGKHMAPRTYAPQLEEFRLPTYPVSGIRGNVVLLQGRRSYKGKSGGLRASSLRSYWRSFGRLRTRLPGIRGNVVRV
ncbi:MAG: hypothetical protein BJ554DRAFT_8070, partial [Olpidium bornovanus]